MKFLRAYKYRKAGYIGGGGGVGDLNLVDWQFGKKNDKLNSM